MNINYYKLWVKNNNFSGLNFKSFERFEDIYLLTFKEKQTFLLICLSSIESFVFFNNNTKNLPFQKLNDLNNFNFVLNHAVMSEINLVNNDKILQLKFIKWNIYNQQEIYNLYLELIPRYQNIILTKQDNKTETIIECLKKISFAENNTRQILPGSEYIPPITNYTQTDIEISDTNINSYLSNFFDEKIISAKINSLKNSILKTINKELSKQIKKRQKQTDELNSALNIDIWHHFVELLKASFTQIKPGMKSITLTNYFDNSNSLDGIFPEIEIPLNEKLNPQKNIDYYVKKYKKALKGQKIIQQNLNSTQEEVLNLTELYKEIEEINDYIELKEKQELIKNQKILSHSTYNNGEKSLFRKLTINEDWDILIGRSSKENDLLTCKTAKGDDWWFHTRVFHGTHVVLRNYKKQIPPEKLIILCCRLAAWYSKAKHSSNVPVDYTKIRFVRKPRSSAPGFVIYTNQKTYYADPLDFKQALSEVNNFIKNL